MDKKQKLEKRIENIEKLVEEIHDIVLVPYNHAFNRGKRNRKKPVISRRKK